LADFIEANYRLFSVLGIFTALTVFSSNFKPVELGIFISFAFMTCTLMVWFSIMTRLPENMSQPLQLFTYCLVMILCGIVAHWFIGYKSIWKDHARTIVFLLLVSVIAFARVKLGYTRYDRFLSGLSGWKKSVIEWGAYILLIMLVLVASDFMAFIISKAVAK